LEAPAAALGVHDVLVKGFIVFWPLRLTFRVLRELPVKVGNMLLAGCNNPHSNEGHTIPKTRTRSDGRLFQFVTRMRNSKGRQRRQFDNFRNAKTNVSKRWWQESNDAGFRRLRMLKSVR